MTVGRSRTRLLKLMLTMFAVALGACALEQSEGAPSEVGAYDPEESAGEVLGQEQAFLTMQDAQWRLIAWSRKSSGGMYICVDGDGSAVNATNRPTTVAQVKQAIMAWITAAQPSASVPLIAAADIYLDCSYYDVKINYSAQSASTAPKGRPYFNPATATIHLFEDWRAWGTLLHEMGHAFGLDDTYIEGTETCQAGQPPSLMCGERVALAGDDKVAIQEIYCIAHPSSCKRRKQGSLGWCVNPATLLVGDFNGDGRDDALCRTPSGLNMAWLMDTTGWFSSSGKTPFSWCTQGQVFVGNFNGDAYDDLLCHNPSNGDKSIAYGTSSGNFQMTWSAAAGWCNHSTGELLVGDFDGDGRDDILCHDVLNGRLWTWHANTSGTFTGARPPYDFPSNINFCLGTSRKLKVGKFDQNKRSDLVCVNTANGGIQRTFSNTSGLFTVASSSQLPGWCHAGYGQVFVGDVSGEGTDDLVCHRGTLHVNKEVALSDPYGNFYGKSREWPMNWCSHTAGLFLLGDFNGDGASDFMCSDTSTGMKWMAYSVDWPY